MQGLIPLHFLSRVCFQESTTNVSQPQVPTVAHNHLTRQHASQLRHSWRLGETTTNQFHDIRIQITSQTPSSLELSRIRTGNNITTWNETITKLSFAFSALSPDKMRTAPFSSSFFHSMSLAAQINDFRTHLLHAHFLFWQLSEPIVPFRNFMVIICFVLIVEFFFTIQPFTPPTEGTHAN